MGLCIFKTADEPPEGRPGRVEGDEIEIPYPRGTAELDYELEVGADGQIGGLTAMNDWPTRDIQRKEMRVGLGPAKAKNFASPR